MFSNQCTVTGSTNKIKFCFTTLILLIFPSGHNGTNFKGKLLQSLELTLWLPSVPSFPQAPVEPNLLPVLSFVLKYLGLYFSLKYFFNGKLVVSFFYFLLGLCLFGLVRVQLFFIPGSLWGSREICSTGFERLLVSCIVQGRISLQRQSCGFCCCFWFF